MAKSVSGMPSVAARASRAGRSPRRRRASAPAPVGLGEPVDREVVRDLVEIDADGAEAHGDVALGDAPLSAPIGLRDLGREVSVFFSMPSPSEKRTKAWIFTSPPSFLPSSWRILSMVPAGGSHTLSWPRSVTSVNHLATLPSMIFGQACSGLPSSLSCASKISFCFVDLRLAGPRRLRTTSGFIAAICIATLSTNAREVGVLRVGAFGVDEHGELAARVDVRVDEAAGSWPRARPAADDACSRPSSRRAPGGRRRPSCRCPGTSERRGRRPSAPCSRPRATFLTKALKSSPRDDEVGLAS